MALKPFYNKKGHLGMTRAELLEKLNSGGSTANHLYKAEINFTATKAGDSLTATGALYYMIATVNDTVPTEADVYLILQYSGYYSENDKFASINNSGQISDVLLPQLIMATLFNADRYFAMSISAAGDVNTWGMSDITITISQVW